LRAWRKRHALATQPRTFAAGHISRLIQQFRGRN